MESEYLELYKSVVSEISKGMEQVKECCSNKEQDGFLERMLSSHEEALLILTGRAPQGQCQSGISSLSDPPDSPTGSKDARSRLWKREYFKRRNKIVKIEASSDSELPHEDGYAWRKYGKKAILNAKYPRGYYRCIQSKTCLAKKRVQRSDDGTVFEVTYKGQHTCPGRVLKKKKKFIEAEQEGYDGYGLDGTLTGGKVLEG
ncbi:probable WRKY transcription factor 41 isoform X2 [Salvia miltiorrhiza]|nr:probable WRKY transcription factor 41 isoform X2 [Salvia miltiorrhiza]XP_057786429.1 probable WRKY transcription factor 41 isoform X2 [Salvia miltiorrhiza]XP_057786435.1 probable WRKY transcription factor 41 isoform X2 [Salvia miltiorrhiza]